MSEFLTQKRALVKLQDRHRVVLESWIAKQEPDRDVREQADGP